MMEEIIRNKPEGATHWQAGYYYLKSNAGLWFKFDDDRWWGCTYQVHVLGMTKIPDGLPHTPPKLPEVNIRILGISFTKVGALWNIHKSGRSLVCGIGFGEINIGGGRVLIRGSSCNKS